MATRTYHIEGLDCGEEVLALQQELGSRVGGVDKLSFDVLNARITLADDALPISDEDLFRAVARTGMRAEPYTPDACCAPVPVSESRWNSRTVLFALSGLFMVLGYGAHIATNGFIEALKPDFAEPVYSLPAKILFLASIVCGIWRVLPRAWLAARRFRPDMYLLMTISISGALGIGDWAEASMVTFLFALSLLLESWSVGRARQAVRKLMDLSPEMASTVCPHDGCIESRPAESVRVGSTVLVRPGERVPLDGIVTKGSSSVNQAPITGESIPAAKGLDDEVYAGTVNLDGVFEFRTTKPAGDTALARIIRLVEQAQSRRAPTEQWVERFARVYTPFMLIAAIAVAVTPPLLFGGAWVEWFYQALVLLLIACPCAFVLSTPISVVAGLTSAARAGVLIKGGAYLEEPARLRALALDKTGTVTHGRPEVQRVLPLNGHTPAELLSLAAAMEAHGTHPLARAVLAKAHEEGVAFRAADDYQVIQGKGARGIVEGRPHWIGSRRFLLENCTECAEFDSHAAELEDAGHSVIALGNDEHVCGFIGVADRVRPDARAAIAELKRLGISPIVLLTGDHAGTAAAVAEEVGCDTYHAELLPEDKVRLVEELVRRHGRVGMVGDGINDTPAMAASTLGIAMGAAGSDAALETADVALMSDDLSKLPWLIRHARRTLNTIKVNITIALGLKAIFFSLALAGYATLGMAIAADMGGSLLVIFNSLRLLQYKEQ